MPTATAGIAAVGAFLSLITAVPTCGWSPDGSQAPVTHQVDTLSNGTIVVRNEVPLSLSATPGWFAEEELRIGSVGGGGPEQFGRINGIEIDSAGNIYVADGMAMEIRVFRPDGSFSHSIGGPGKGPGEFESVWGLKLDPEGKLWVRDAMLARYSVFSRTGTLIAAHAVPVAESSIRPWLSSIDGAGRVTVMGYQTPWPPRDGRWEASSGFPGKSIHHPIRLSFLGESTEVDSFPPLLETREAVDGLRRIKKPYSGGLISYLPDGNTLWFAHTKEYRIGRRTLQGDTTLVISMPARAEQVSSAERAEVARKWLTGRRIPLDQVMDEKPVLEAITIGDAGRIYAFPHLKDIEGGSAVDIFEPSGRFLARVPLPTMVSFGPGRPNPVVRNGLMYAVTLDALDVHHVVRLRIDGDAGMQPR